ncbi:MAG: DUF4838 domain-containing protein [Armatimonadota bacterium]
MLSSHYDCRLSGLMLLLLLLASLAGAAASPFPGYRDLKVYTVSVPDERNPRKIVASTQFINMSENELTITATLKHAEHFSFRGGKFSATLLPHATAVWVWAFTVPDGFTREVLTGGIAVNGRPERELYVTVQGADPEDFADKGVMKITDRAQVVATYAPRTRGSVLAEQAYLKATQPKPVMTLAAKGKTDYVIVVEALPLPPKGQDALAFWKGEKLTDPQKELLTAVEDLQRCLQLKTGAVLPVMARSGRRAILLRIAGLGDAATGLHEAYRLETVGHDLFIEAADVAGLRNGVYGLLTDHLDCHWFQPKQLGEEIMIPKDKTVRLPALNEVRGSSWYSVAGVSWGAERLWDERLRAFTNRGRMNFGHSWAGYVGKAEYPFDKFPEYYARDREGKILEYDNGWSGTNFCSTNPEVLDIVAKKVNAFFAANPEAPVCSIDPNDYGKMCLCDNCLALDKQYGQTKEDGTDVSDRMLHFSSEIARRLDPKYQAKYLGILVYGYQIELPFSAKPHDRHAGTICNMAWIYDHSRPWNDPTSPQNRHFYDLVKGWGKLLPQYGYYDYYGHWSAFGPWSMVSKLREDLAAFHDVGGTFLVHETQPNFAAQGLNHYIAGRLSWDIDADVDLLLEEFFTQYYGPAAGPMRAYWLGGERWYNTERPSNSNPPRAYYHPEFWTELDGYLQQARKLTAKLPPAQQRFTDRVQIACDGFEYGRLMFGYDRDFGEYAKKFEVKIDHAAAIKYLQEHSPRMKEIAQKYPAGDPYWPMLLPSYLVWNLDDMLKGHEEALKKETAYNRPTTFAP